MTVVPLLPPHPTSITLRREGDVSEALFVLGTAALDSAVHKREAAIPDAMLAHPSFGTRRRVLNSYTAVDGTACHVVAPPDSVFRIAVVS